MAWDGAVGWGMFAPVKSRCGCGFCGPLPLLEGPAEEPPAVGLVNGSDGGPIEVTVLLVDPKVSAPSGP